MDEPWQAGLSPWTMTEANGRFYGRGTADNKGQHTINLAALKAVLETRGKLGFNAKFLLEMGEERGSPGLRQICASQRERAEGRSADRLGWPAAEGHQPTIFLGSRGTLPFDLVIKAREREYHSGNWGGALSNPAIQLAHAIASLVGPTGQILVPELKPPHHAGVGAPGARRLRARERRRRPRDQRLVGRARAHSGRARVRLVLAGGAGVRDRHSGVAGQCNSVESLGADAAALRRSASSPQRVIPAVRAHLERNGFAAVEVRQVQDDVHRATRLSPDNPWVDWAVALDHRDRPAAKPTVLPNFGGTLPNDCFADILEMPTLWVPHSYPACAQHAPNEHLPVAIAREGLAIMAGLYWDFGEAGLPA